MEQANIAYHQTTATSEFDEPERLGELARHNETAALRHAAEVERERWLGVLTDKDAVIALIKARLADRDAEILALRAQLGVSSEQHNEAAALRYAAELERGKWLGLVADKDAVIVVTKAELSDKEAEITALRAQLGESKEPKSVYYQITELSEFKEAERLRSLARHNEAAALRHAAEVEREKWQGVVADKDAALADKDAEIKALKAQLGGSK